MKLLVCVLLCCAANAQQAAEITGSVVDARGGEALGNVVIQAGTFRATTDAAGRFRLRLPPGDHTLNISTVGYHLLKKTVHIEAGETRELNVVLSPETFRRTDSVAVHASPWDPSRADSPSTLVLGGNDAKNLASVLADDPLRAVQALPGVSSNNDFDARFSLRGADYSRIGLYLDNVLLHAPFHMLQGQRVSGSATAFNGDLVEQLELHEGAFPVRFEDRTAGALDVHTRDGNRSGNSVRISASASNAGAMAEGPLGRRRRGSWLVGGRKSYLQYIFARAFPDTAYLFGFQDVQGRLTYDLTPRHNVTLYLLESFSNLDRDLSRSRPGINGLVGAGYHYSLGNLGWRYSPDDRFILVNHFAWMREKFDNTNLNQQPLSTGFYGEWVWNANATWLWDRHSHLDFGASTRRLRSGGFMNQYRTGSPAPGLVDRHDGTAMREGGYVQQSWRPWTGRLRFTAGVRFDHHSLAQAAAVSPQASLSFALTPATRLQIGFGQYVQFPEISFLTSILGSPRLLPSRSNQWIAGIEHRLGERTRVRVEYYDRQDRDLLFQPLYDPRILNGTAVPPAAQALYLNSLRGYARGVEVFLQRSSANGVTGWISYAFGRTGMRDGVTGNHFPSDFDQRHTVNLYGSYRLKPTINLSVKASYGSGFPIPGYLRQQGSQYFLTNVRNQLRLPAFVRTDVRVNKAWTKNKWKLTLFGEVVNLTNRTNYLYDSFDGYDSRSQRAYVTLDAMFPIMPSVGLVFER